MNSIKNRNLDKCVGAILGAAAGDALGWPWEQNSKNVIKTEPKDKEMFQRWNRYDGGNFWYHYEEINQGEYSDDTQLIIATARSLKYGNNWSKNFTRVELPAWLSYERGGGSAIKRAARVWKKGHSPWNLEKEKETDVQRYFNAGGNGVAMRILPHVFICEEKYEEVMHQIFINGIFTHGHPRALIGATLYADALMYLLNKENTLSYGELIDYLLNRKDKWGNLPITTKTESWLKSANTVLKDKYVELWDSVVGEVIDLLKMAKKGIDNGALDIGNDILDKLGCFDKNVNGAGTITAVAAIYLASKYASSPKLGIIEAAYLKNADTDTLASMVGGLLGMIHGQEFLSDSWSDIQDYEYLKKLIHLEPVEYSTLKGVLFDYSNNQFRNRLKQIKQGEIITALPFGQLILKDKIPNKSKIDGANIHTLKFLSEDGQSIYVKIFKKDTSRKTKNIQGKVVLKPVEHQQVENQMRQVNMEFGNKPYQAILTEKKIRHLVNILPKNILSNVAFTFIADIMYEMERSRTGIIDDKGINQLYQRWKKHNISIEHINKIRDIIDHY